MRRRVSRQVRESTLALKPRADVTRSPKQEYQWLHKKDLCPTKILKKKSVMEHSKVHAQVSRQFRNSLEAAVFCFLGLCGKRRNFVNADHNV